PTIPTPSKVVKQGTEVTKDQVQTLSSQITAPVQPSVAQSETPISEPIVASAFPLPGESSNWQYKFPLPVNVVPTARRLKMPLPRVCTAIEKMMKKLPVKDRWQLH
nr:hypothetical protein [Tanacetum cinerariifolium]